MRIAIDTGGTFTDVVYVERAEIKVIKVFSTPAEPARAILEALNSIGVNGPAEIRHGTTVATNTLLERTGGRVAFVTTAGMEDTIAIGRQARPRLYDWFATPAPPLAAEGLRFGVPERTAADGAVLQRPTPAELARLAHALRDSGAQSAGVSLLFSFANPANELAVAEALTSLGIPVTLSHQLLPEFREFERASTVLVNAYLAPRMGSYLSQLSSALAGRNSAARLDIMQSSGGIVAAELAAREPVRTVLSGPAGGVVGASAVARLSGFERIICFDMGGTSTDVTLVDGAWRTTNESMVAGLPVSVPVIDIHTVGAGGGSIARFGSDGLLRVGPESAGATPGPICYGSGEMPTVTDANLLLGRIDPEFFLGGQMRLDESRTRDYMGRVRGDIGSVEAFASSIVRLAEATMEKAIRLISVERGYDPRDFTLVSFGGAGGLHACALARALAIPRVLIPRWPGALSALGILMSDAVQEFSRTVMLAPGSRMLEKHFRELEQQGQREMKAHGLRALSERSLDLRYSGQGYELNVPATGDYVRAFHRAHQARYGYADELRTVEIINARVRLIARSKPAPLRRRRVRPGSGKPAIRRFATVLFDSVRRRTPIYDRALLRPGDQFRGPAIIGEYSATTALPPGCRARVDGWENIIVEASRGGR